MNLIHSESGTKPRSTDQVIDDTLRMDETPYVRLGLITLCATFVLLLGWATLAPLNSAVIAPGRVAVASENKVVQHLDGGLVKHIAVKDGDLVEAGELLLTLDSEALSIRLNQVREQLLEARANLARLAAERDDNDTLDLSATLDAASASELSEEVLQTQQSLFESRRAALGSEREVLVQRHLQTEKQLEGSERLIETLRHRLALAWEDQAAYRKLAGKQLVSASQVREVEARVAELQGDIVAQEGEMARLQESLAEAESNAKLREQEYRKEVIGQLRDLQAQQINLLAEERDINDKLSHIEIRATVAGKVKGFSVVTLGAVISAGQAIMEIVPREQRFTIHARISPLDIDSLHPGLSAEVRIPVFEGARNFPSLYADLADVSTDVYRDEHGTEEPYYKASLNMDEDSLRTLSAQQLKLVSGMPVDVIVKTGERTLLSYLLKPFSDMLARAFNEA